MSKKLLVHIVTFNSAETIGRCLSSIPSHEAVEVMVTDNGSGDDTVKIIKTDFPRVRLNINQRNLGYAAAHNHGFFLAQAEGFELVFLFNPDAILTPDFFDKSLSLIAEHGDYAMYTPKILRTDTQLRPYDPPVIDAAGMILSPWARHFDRGSAIFDRGQYDLQEDVFGGTGAALFIRVAAIAKLALRGSKRDADKLKVYPQLAEGESNRTPVFDEVFFAFREDAELAWRARNISLKTLYVPQLVVLHRRSVTPDRRWDLQPKINSWSVRNRFLMQIVNFRLVQDFGMIVPGIVLWNLLVVFGVVFMERTSLRGLWEVIVLLPRAWERRRLMQNMERSGLYA